MTASTQPNQSDATGAAAVADPPPLGGKAWRREKKLRRKAEKAAARAALLDEVTPPEEPRPKTGFGLFDLQQELLTSVANQGFEEPTPIQSQAIPPMLEGRDLIGQAQTGTGKTAAFALPILQRVEPARRVVQAIVLVPTRELATQAADAVSVLSRTLGGVSVLAVYGGASIHTQLQRLARGVHVVIGTPGRVMDHLRRGSLSLADAAVVVLDEADEMLKMGFAEDVEWILEHAPGPEARQTALFSATMPPAVRHIADRYLTDPLTIAIEPEAPAIATIDQRFIKVNHGQKLDALCRLLELDDGDSTLVFTRTRVDSARLAEALTAEGFAAEALHGDMNQAQRESVLRRLRSGDVRIVVATDVAARGLDVESISLVVNFDVPGDAETYVHRIGRTGRAGRAGTSVLFLTYRDRHVLAGVQRYTGQRLQQIHPPTAQDVVAHRVERFKAAVGQAIADTDLGPYRKVIEDIVEEGSHDVADVAAAVAHLAAEHRPLFTVPEPPPRRTPPPREESRPRRAPRPQNDRAPRGPRKSGAKMVTLVLSIGRQGGVGPADIVGAIANEAGVPGKVIGSIDIGDRDTFVDVEADCAEYVLERVHGAKIRGRRTSIRPTRPGETARRSHAESTPRRTNRDAGWSSPRRGRG